MTRVHDMGGRFGDGAVVPEAEDVVFHADWHPRALAITLACGSLGLWNIDVSRHARECLAPQDYARLSYYEKWMAALADLLVDTGAVTRDELAQASVPGPSDLADKRLTAAAVAGALAKGGPATRPSNVAAQFNAGDRVRIRSVPENVLARGGHTRLPPMRPELKAQSYGRMARMSCRTAMRTGWAKHPNLSMPWRSRQRMSGRIRNIRKTR